jgi:pimeloyl-ACP methyl ester carboxylesterase
MNRGAIFSRKAMVESVKLHCLTAGRGPTLAYFVSFNQAAKDFAELSESKLRMPALAIGGEKAFGKMLGQQLKVVASNPNVVVLNNTGHWVLEENPKGITAR